MTETDKNKTFVCANCNDELKRVYSKKKSRWYWVCQNAEKECGKWYSEKNGAPVLRPAQKGEPDPDKKCPDCGSAGMRKVSGGSTGDFLSCARYPECKGTVDLQDDGSLASLCHENPDHGPMRRRKGTNGLFWSCRRYPECTATQEITGARKKRAKVAAC